jgi:recA bacterial DNA recombination protein
MAAALPFLTREAALLSTSETIWQRPLVVRPEAPLKPKELLEITGVFRGRELTRKERRLTCGIAPIDRLIGGGIVRGRISEIIGNPGAGKTSLAAAFAASVTARGEVAAWIDAGGGFDPASIAAAGVDLARMLWVAMPANRIRPGSRTVDEVERDRCGASRPAGHFDDLVYDRTSLPGYSAAGRRRAQRPASMVVLKAAEWILAAGGFGLVVIDCGGLPDFSGRFSAFTQSAALRLAHGAERGGAAVIVIAPHRMCGTFAALSLMLSRNRACFSRASGGAPVLFDGLTVEARVVRNKLGGSGGAATWRALADPAGAAWPESALSPDSSHASHLPQLPNSAKTAQSTGRRAAAR